MNEVLKNGFLTAQYLGRVGTKITANYGLTYYRKLKTNENKQKSNKEKLQEVALEAVS